MVLKYVKKQNRGKRNFKTDIYDSGIRILCNNYSTRFGSLCPKCPVKAPFSNNFGSTYENISKFENFI